MWFKIDDEAWMSHKLQELTPAAGWLWAMVGSRCGHDHTEGRVTPVIERQVRALFDLDAELVTELVEKGHWHSPSTIKKCAACKHIPRMLADGRLKPGEFYIHDWLVYQFTRDQSLLPEHRVKATRNKRLSNNAELRQQVYERDHGLCRYCSIRVDFKDRHSGDGGTWDHVDPTGPNTLDNVVTACRTCNSFKNDRTPEEAGMVVLAPGQTLDLTLDKPWSNSGLTTRARTREIGTGRTGGQSWSDPGTEIDDASGEADA